MHQKNAEMKKVMELLNSGNKTLNLAIHFARYDENETNGDFSTFENQTDIFFRRVRELLAISKLIEHTLGTQKCHSCMHQFDHKDMCIRYDDDPNFDPDSESPHHYPPRPCKTGWCKSFDREFQIPKE